MTETGKRFRNRGSRPATRLGLRSRLQVTPGVPPPTLLRSAVPPESPPESGQGRQKRDEQWLEGLGRGLPPELGPAWIPGCSFRCGPFAGHPCGSRLPLTLQPLRCVFPGDRPAFTLLGPWDSRFSHATEESSFYRFDHASLPFPVFLWNSDRVRVDSLTCRVRFPVRNLIENISFFPFCFPDRFLLFFFLFF